MVIEILSNKGIQMSYVKNYEFYFSRKSLNVCLIEKKEDLLYII
jgi:hypothetical protein